MRRAIEERISRPIEAYLLCDAAGFLGVGMSGAAAEGVLRSKLDGSQDGGLTFSALRIKLFV